MRDAIGIVCDVSKKEDISNLVQKTVLKYVKINYLVCNAAVDYPTRKPFEMADDRIRKLW
jgi:NAD(P)-dependent dehydrogenase (short-subunit alcohol dehydrogenase family)